MIETKRLILRKLTPSDYDDLCKILQDDEVMYAYEGAFSNTEVYEWLEKQLNRYEEDGFATEAAKACKEYAFHVLGANSVCSIIRDTNIASQNVAIRNEMKVIDIGIKHYRNVDMPHFLYSVSKTNK